VCVLEGGGGVRVSTGDHILGGRVIQIKRNLHSGGSFREPCWNAARANIIQMSCKMLVMGLGAAPACHALHAAASPRVWTVVGLPRAFAVTLRMPSSSETALNGKVQCGKGGAGKTLQSFQLPALLNSLHWQACQSVKNTIPTGVYEEDLIRVYPKPYP